ncbi:MAG: hypothetical protein J0L56_11150 [Chitinophagales bacterium]|nr:hypothetical protein [Chitinophagales bacterium]
MKSVFNFRNTAIALLTVVTLAIAPAAQAIDETNNTAAVELKFLGNFKNKPVFELNFKHGTADNEYVVIIRDSFGNSLYRENVNSNVISKKFMLNIEEVGDGEALRFEITGKKSNKTVVYEINQNTHYIEETLVKKIN